MADIVLAIGASHSPMLNATAADYPLHAEIDRGQSDWKRALTDKSGRPISYDDLLAGAEPGLEDKSPWRRSRPGSKNARPGSSA